MAKPSRGQDAHRDTPARALPQVRVLLPDGRVTGRLVRRWQTGDGTRVTPWATKRRNANM
ncbi:hypothetical protein ACIBBB_35795 [Streptomyces sp. NPDC051217]|uniref:hypothetical protein n=1 Tax=Streptomyces sp. NPDC051217 TaxID=3365644 RepID=UPI00379BA875